MSDPTPVTPLAQFPREAALLAAEADREAAMQVLLRKRRAVVEARLVVQQALEAVGAGAARGALLVAEAALRIAVDELDR